MFSMTAVAIAICWDAATTSGFMVSNRGDSVVDPHEVGVFNKVVDEFTCVMPLSLSCYLCDRYEALFRGGVYLADDLIQSLIEVLDGKSFPETSVLIYPLPVAVAPSVLVIGSLIGGALADNSSSEMPSRYRSDQFSEVPESPVAMKTSRSGVQSRESVVATSVGVCSSSFGASGVPSCNGSVSR
jgi:hypothetical protein